MSETMVQAQIPIPFQGIPEDIQHHRQMMFSLEQPVHFTEAVYEKYFPYIDNVWCFHEPKGEVSVKTGVEKLRGACRLHRKPNKTKPGQEARKRREGTGTCDAKFKLTIQPDGSRILEKFGDKGHSHDLDFIDSIKRNSAVRKIILHEFFKSWDAGAILAFLRDPLQRVDGRDLLKEAGGQYISRSEISNVMTGALKRAHPGQDPFEIKRQQEKYKSFMTCGVKGCQAPPFSDPKEFKKHRQEAHGFQKHDHSHKIPCPNKTCGRRKQSRGFVSLTALQEHQRRYHGIEPSATNGAEGGSPEDEITAALTKSTGDAATDDAEGEDEDEETPDAEETPTISGAARRHMETRLAQMENQRLKLDEEIAKMRQKLYGQVATPGEEMQITDGADFTNDLPLSV
ncbi:hypothetical protein NA57DRAFT_72273 [Rhizodiscina lignyota]|uniref:C2H2-type domain-containing protein n=1 Tax=Rhizodiscina lignyota TaxID=1504668 RepID=A0A9P4INW4_9PEZI|nr:hypothetical protein NA57DRAFT_72273 [Rhizodiscina lignyota]